MFRRISELSATDSLDATPRRAEMTADKCPNCGHEFDEPQTREQQERYHAMLADVARQCRHLNEVFSDDDWKRLCVDLFRKESMDDQRLAAYWKRSGFRLVPSLDGSGLVALGEQTRRFPKYVASAFVEWLYAYGAEKSVEWSDPTVPPIDVYQREAA